jgi:hypothetical protein
MTRFVIALSMMLVVAIAPFGNEAEANRYPGNFGIGVGSTTIASGLSLKQFAGPTSFQLAAGCWRSCDGVAASLDFLANMPALASGNVLSLAWNFGAGAAAGVGDGSIGAAGAFVLGLEVIFAPLPIDLVLEWRPAVHVVPDVGIDLVTFGGHLRFYPL